ncbi:MAG: 2-C-methyl-D-erythritol 2,4-cyclodiphosphate synthase [Desulfomonilaceae bacterium]|nr:2-C-methyl-D-erythritol 2,4-cyclodiphosphate synthase [Desulfomonilaceae bacterium]
MRIGQGFDAHKFVEGRKLVLGGEVIDHSLGLEGHSDADVLTHAVIDALLGAAGLGDIGMHFPDSDPQYRDARSLDMLKVICQAVDALGFRIANIDTTVFAQRPKIANYRAAMVGNLSSTMGVDPQLVNVKATTTEGMGFVGRGEGIAAAAVVLLEKDR